MAKTHTLERQKEAVEREREGVPVRRIHVRLNQTNIAGEVVKYKEARKNAQQGMHNRKLESGSRENKTTQRLTSEKRSISHHGD